MADHISDSESSEGDTPSTPSPGIVAREASQPASTLVIRESPNKPSADRASVSSESSNVVAVMVAGPARPWEYAPFQGATTVDSVLAEFAGPKGDIWYKIEFEDGKKQDVSADKLLELRNGQNALDFYNNANSAEVSRESSAEPNMSSRGKRTRTKPQNENMVDSTKVDLEETEEEDSSSDGQAIVKKRRFVGKGRVSELVKENPTQRGSRVSSRLSSRAATKMTVEDESSESSDSSAKPVARSGRSNPRVSGRSTNSNRASRSKKQADNDDEDELAADVIEIEDSDESENSGFIDAKDKRKSLNARRSTSMSAKGRKGRPKKIVEESSSSDERPEPTRRSGRDNKIRKNMREQDVDEELYAEDDAVNHGPKIISIREIYQPVPKQSRFAKFHKKDCDVCDGTGDHSNKGTSQLVYCQGCSTSIHKVCLGYRSAREHRVTKIGHENFVLQCKRCIGLYSKKNPTNPRLNVCTGCHKIGDSCSAFSAKKTSKQEQKLREENDGDDPITKVAEDLINNADSLLFRCVGCKRAWHFDHLPPKDDEDDDMDEDEDETNLRLERYKQYASEWQCNDCSAGHPKVQGFAAWRAIDREAYESSEAEDKADTLREDEKEYLVKWTDRSYTKCTWMPGAWVWGVTMSVMRTAFYEDREGENIHPKWTLEEAVPEEFMAMEIVFDVKYNEDYEPRTLAADKAHIGDVEEVLVKFQGLGYEETVWEAPPSPENADRFAEFVSAYNEYLNGIYFKHQPTSQMNDRIREFRSMNFQKKILMKKQPTSLSGGQIMGYQLEGLNWLLHNFHQKKNGILADEMGLGKTIQVIAMIAALVLDKPKCWPFLIVTPNATCANWRREIKKWAPNLRVVAYYGPKQARDIAMEYELYPGGGKEMSAHVVITSYEPPVKQGTWFRSIKWAGLIVDEGQRLKNEDGLLYKALKTFKIPFQLLLTGTPLQNNKRELFNLLQFLDPKLNASELDETYEEVTSENLKELHELIKPFFLRRTKLQVLKFLPPMAQVILPVSMCVVQKKLYKSILAKNSNLIRAILGQNVAAVSVKERGNLNNILMQLRKCLSHPFIYSSLIEERKVDDAALHRNLIDASSKFQLLELMLPKLKERGHRVLLFSQFLNQLDLVEDFLHGMGLQYQRLDGSIGSIEKQKRIDHFNAPDSTDFAFLLSTRAGGVGINLATADTVIVMDPDFNPHQDIQAFSRAHRIGQKKKVLVFQLMTKDSAEEKIIQIGRKKMALDKALIESMDADDDAGVDVESILKHGAAALFNDDDRNDIRYDSASVDKLLDRTQIENPEADAVKNTETQFAYARVWANDKDDLVGDIEVEEDEAAPDLSVWDKILKEREAEAAAEAAKNLKAFGRGQRVRAMVDYQRESMDLDDVLQSSPPNSEKRGKRGPKGSDDDDDFAGPPVDSGKDEESDGSTGPVDPRELETHEARAKAQVILNQSTATPRVPQQHSPSFSSNGIRQQGVVPSAPMANSIRPQPQHSHAPQQIPFSGPYRPQLLNGSLGNGGQFPQSFQNGLGNQGISSYSQNNQPMHMNNQFMNQSNQPMNFNGQQQMQRTNRGDAQYCHDCQSNHIPGGCLVRRVPVDPCPMCGIPHFGIPGTCPNLKNEAQIRIMIDALNNSTEAREQITAAHSFLVEELLRLDKERKKKRLLELTQGRGIA